jgi:large conductance mechanosensitive channel
MSVIKDFKKFLMQGDFISMAVAFVVGLAVVALITAIVNSLITPLIGIAFHANFSKVGIVVIDGSSFTLGALLGAIINFVILLAVVFFVMVYPLEQYRTRHHPPAPPVPLKTCPSCYSEIDARSTRCKYCTTIFTQ